MAGDDVCLEVFSENYNYFNKFYTGVFKLLRFQGKYDIVIMHIARRVVRCIVMEKECIL